MTNETQIERNAGKCVGGYMVGAGYRGKRDDQDEAVVEFAERLADEFPEYGVEIRYNSDQLSGGAWLKDTKRNAQVGLGAALRAPEWYVVERERRTWGDSDEDVLDMTSLKRLDPDELKLKYTVKINHPAVEEHRCNNNTDRDDRVSYLHKDFHTLEGAWGYFTWALERDELNPPSDE